MATATQANSPVLLDPVQDRASLRSDRWLAALMAVLVVAMLAGLARRVDVQSLTSEGQPPVMLLD